MRKGNDTQNISITVSRQLLEKVDKQAKEMYISRSAYIVTAMAQKVQSEELLRALPQFTETVRAALRSEQSKSKLSDIVLPETEIPYMDATREGAEKLDFIQGLNEDIAKAKR